MAAAELVISGLGVTSAVGQGQPEFTAALLAGRHAFDVMKRPGRQSDSAFLGAEIGDLRPMRALSAQVSRTASFSSLVALATLEEAWIDARLADVDPERIGLVVGGSNLQQREIVQAHASYSGRANYIRPTYALSFLDTDLCGFCTAQFGIRGPSCTVGGASASGQLAVIQAARTVRSGEADVCVALGALMDLSHWECQALRSAGAMGSDQFATQPALACRPFDRQSDGFIFGEGCAAVVVERADPSGARVARPYARLSGWAAASDGNRNANPSLEGEVRVISAALQAAGCAPSQVDYINPHGSGSQLGDETELAAMHASGLSHARINATKSIIGHCLTAAGTVEVVATLVQMRSRRLHPTRNLLEPIDAAFNWVGAESVSHTIAGALTLSLGFGGINTALVLEACG